MFRTRFLLAAAIAALTLAANGCSEFSFFLNPIAVQADDEPRHHTWDESLVKKEGTSRSSKESEGVDIILFLIPLIMIGFGGYLASEKKFFWGLPLVAIGTGWLLLFHFDPEDLHWNWNPVGWRGWILVPLIAVWSLSKVTDRFKWDDRVIQLGSLGMLLLSLVWGGLGFNSSTSWWILENLWVFLLLELAWNADWMKARKSFRFLLVVVLWYVLCSMS